MKRVLCPIQIIQNQFYEIAMIGINHQPLPAAGREDDIIINLAYSM
jgi:hypothetical protein